MYIKLMTTRCNIKIDMTTRIRHFTSDVVNIPNPDNSQNYWFGGFTNPLYFDESIAVGMVACKKEKKRFIDPGSYFFVVLIGILYITRSTAGGIAKFKCNIPSILLGFFIFPISVKCDKFACK